MAQDYDKIFKENIEDIILPLAEKILGTSILRENLEEIPDELQRTLERKPDFLKKVLHEDKEKEYILHLEFQKDDDQKMVYRMHEYYAMLLRKYQRDIHQYVFFIDKGKASMPTSLNRRNLQFSFSVINLQDFDYQIFVNSTTPEEVILAILADFGTDQPITVIQAVLQRLKSLPTETLRREKCVVQLEVLSNLRNLQLEIIKQLGAMAFVYDLEKDIRFQQGMEKGMEKGIEQGIEQGMEKSHIDAIQNMLKSNVALENIAKYLAVSLEFVKKIADSFKK